MKGGVYVLHPLSLGRPMITGDVALHDFWNYVMKSNTAFFSPLGTLLLDTIHYDVKKWETTCIGQMQMFWLQDPDEISPNYQHQPLGQTPSSLGIPSFKSS